MLRVALGRTRPDPDPDQNGKISGLQFASTGSSRFTVLQLVSTSPDISNTTSAVPQSHDDGKHDAAIELAAEAGHG
jgi:hypothetical protein